MVEWPADWAMYAGNNTSLGFNLSWWMGTAVLVAMDMRERA
ncbi:hypothetical protein [Phormidium tenue]|nr:hypothetical protein [Phormidium tenue]